MACLHMPVDRVPAGVELAVGEPFVERRVVVEERLDGVSSQSMPERRIHPEGVRIALRGGI
jgi:hypothetical protein